MIVGSAPETAVARIFALRASRPSALPVASLPIVSERGAVDDAGGVARGVDVVDLLDPVVLLERDGVEAAHLAHRGERRLQAAERLDGRAGADELVVVQDDLVVEVLDRDDGVREAALGLRGRTARSCERAA